MRSRGYPRDFEARGPRLAKPRFANGERRESGEISDQERRTSQPGRGLTTALPPLGKVYGQDEPQRQSEFGCRREQTARCPISDTALCAYRVPLPLCYPAQAGSSAGALLARGCSRTEWLQHKESGRQPQRKVGSPQPLPEWPETMRPRRCRWQRRRVACG